MATMTTPDDVLCCADCAQELEDGSRDADEVWRGVGECIYCHEQGCEWHAHNYNSGFAHESCHEANDYTRAEEGEY